MNLDLSTFNPDAWVAVITALGSVVAAITVLVRELRRALGDEEPEPEAEPEPTD